MIVLNVYPWWSGRVLGLYGEPRGPWNFLIPHSPRYCTCANLLTQDHWQIQGYSSSGHSINQGSLQKWTGGTHLHIWHTWLQWNHRILIVWIIFLVKYSGGNLRLNAQHVRMSVPLSVRMSVRLSVAMIYYIPTYIIHNIQQSCGVFSMGISNWLVLVLSYFYTPSQRWILLRFCGTFEWYRNLLLLFG